MVSLVRYRLSLEISLTSEATSGMGRPLSIVAWPSRIGLEEVVDSLGLGRGSVSEMKVRHCY